MTFTFRITRNIVVYQTYVLGFSFFNYLKCERPWETINVVKLKYKSEGPHRFVSIAIFYCTYQGQHFV